MKITYLIALIFLLNSGCAGKKAKAKANLSLPEAKVNQKLADQLAKMAKTDQIAAFIPQGKYQELSEAQWRTFQDSVFTTHQKQIEEIFMLYGFPGYNVVGKQGSRNFWLIVQHSDKNPEFQKKVLKKMKTEIEKGNASPKDYGYLVDRVNLNNGKPQLYGTQVDYDTLKCQAYVKVLADRRNVNKRRKSLGLLPLEEYLNEMTLMHFEMNKEKYLTQGITEPTLYRTGEASR